MLHCHTKPVKIWATRLVNSCAYHHLVTTQPLDSGSRLTNGPIADMLNAMATQKNVPTT